MEIKKSFRLFHFQPWYFYFFWCSIIPQILENFKLVIFKRRFTFNNVSSDVLIFMENKTVKSKTFPLLINHPQNFHSFQKEFCRKNCWENSHFHLHKRHNNFLWYECESENDNRQQLYWGTFSPSLATLSTLSWLYSKILIEFFMKLMHIFCHFFMHDVQEK